MKHSRILFALLAMTLSLALSMPAFAAEPTQYVKDKTKVVTEILSKPDSKKRAQELEKVLRDTIDFRELASRALGEHWASKSAEQQQQFLDLLQELLQANYQTKLQGKKLGEDYELTYVDEKTRKDKAIVKTVVVAKGEKKPVDYRLMKKEGGWAIYDVVIDDISLEETYRESYVEIIEQEGWDSLIKRMKDKAKELREGGAKE